MLYGFFGNFGYCSYLLPKQALRTHAKQNMANEGMRKSVVTLLVVQFHRKSKRNLLK